MIGANVVREDARERINGSVKYTADLCYEGMLHGATVRAPLPHGRITGLVRDPCFDWSRVHFVTADAIPGSRFVKMIQSDMPFLAFDEVMYCGEPVALCAAEDRRTAEAAAAAVRVQMEPAPALLDLDTLVAQHRQGGAGLTELSRWRIARGDVERALAHAAVVIERCYTTPHQEQAYLETNAVIAVPEPPGGMRVEGSMQCPYYVAPAVAAMLGSDLDHVHARALAIGGAFGGKEDYPSLLAGHAALLARVSGRPVLMALDRADDIAFTTKRHPSWVRIRGGADADGRLLGVAIDVVFDGGGYVTMSPVVLSRGAIHAPGPYRWDAVTVDAVAYRSHTPPNGAFRGFGVPQTTFAMESFIDELALCCGQAPDQFRLRNCVVSGDVTATGQVLREAVGAREVLTRAVARSGGSRTAMVRHDASEVARGVGLALFWHGAGFTGAGEARIAAEVAVDLCSDGRVHIRVSSTDMGQGAHTVLKQIVADGLSVPLECVVVDPVDTREVPDSGPTVASRTTMIVGGELYRAADDARRALFAAVAGRHPNIIEESELALVAGTIQYRGAPLLSFAEALTTCLLVDGKRRVTFARMHQLDPSIHWDEATHTGDAYATYAWGCAVAEVVVDRRFFTVEVPRITMVVDVGRAVNPIMATGQVVGGTLQALGFALTEEVGVTPGGRFLRERLQSYIVPTTLDAPEVDVELLELPYSRGPGGAKGLGEMPMNGAAPAIANGICNALGVRLRDLPLLPEKIYAACQDALRARHDGEGQ